MGTCEHGNKHSGSVTGGEFDWLLKKDSGPCS
jgi:hypothetical protein